MNNAIFSLVLGVGVATTAPLHALPKLKLNTEQITLSGLSAGGYMAGQMHVAYSDWVSGVGIIAAGPYYCGQNSIMTALGSCVNKQEPAIDLAALNNQTKDWATQQKIAPLENLNGSKVWLLHGTLDTRVIAPVSDALAEQYQSWQADVVYLNDKAFAHHFPTDNNGHSCDVSEAPFIGNCDFDAAGAMFKHLMPETKPKTVAMAQHLHAINQQTLGGDMAKSLADEGYVYIPKACAKGSECQVHVSFHGCNQNAEAVEKAYALNTGINAWAEANNVVVLYPQTKKSNFLPLNPQACWDWWGYTDGDYATRDGQQIQAVKHMVMSLAGGSHE